MQRNTLRVAKSAGVVEEHASVAEWDIRRAQALRAPGNGLQLANPILSLCFCFEIAGFVPLAQLTRWLTREAIDHAATLMARRAKILPPPRRERMLKRAGAMAHLASWRWTSDSQNGGRKNGRPWALRLTIASLSPCLY